MSVVLCFIYVLKKCDLLIFRKSELVLDKALTADLTSTGLSMGLMYAIVSVGSVILQGAVNSFGTSTITAHTAAKAVISTASKYIVLNISFFFILSVLLVLRSSLQGVGRKLVPVSGSIVEFLLKILAVAVLAPKLGYFGICICEPMIWAACAVIVVTDYVVFIRKTDTKAVDRKPAAVV